MSVEQLYLSKISNLEKSNETLQSYVKRLETQLQQYQLELPGFHQPSETLDEKETEPLPVRYRNEF